jgi:hypothetical protein
MQMKVEYFNIKPCPVCGEEARTTKFAGGKQKYWLCSACGYCESFTTYVIEEPYPKKIAVELPNRMGFSLRADK